jgi:hypothetical protein
MKNIFENAYLILNSDNKVELHLNGKDHYQSLPEEVKSDIKKSFVWGRQRGAWVSRSKDCGVPYFFRKYNVPFKGEEERKEFVEARQVKVERAEYKAEKYEEWAEGRDKQAESLQSEFNRMRSDWSWLTQPNVNTSGGRRFSRSREKVMARYDRGMESRQVAENHRERAEHFRLMASDSELKNESYLINRVKEGEKNVRKFDKFLEMYADKIDKIDSQPDQWKIWLKARMNFYQTAFEKLEFFSEALKELTISKKESGVISADDVQQNINSGVKSKVKKYLKNKYGIDLLKFSKAFGVGVKTTYYIKTEQPLPEEYRSGWASDNAGQVRLAKLISDIEKYNSNL